MEDDDITVEFYESDTLPPLDFEKLVANLRKVEFFGSPIKDEE